MAGKYAGRVGITYWAAGALLMNPMTSWAQSNITICANTLVYNGAQLIFLHTTSTLQGFSALTQFFNNFVSSLLGDIWWWFLHISKCLSILYCTIYISYYCVASFWWVPACVWHYWYRCLWTSSKMDKREACTNKTISKPMHRFQYCFVCTCFPLPSSASTAPPTTTATPWQHRKSGFF